MVRSGFRGVLLGFGALLAGGLGASVAGCAAVYPEITTPIRAVPPGRDLEPPPPADVLYIAISEVEIAGRTRDGRAWDEGGLPDVYAKVFLDKNELFTTDVQRDTLTPTWPTAPKANYSVGESSLLTVELWDDNAVHSAPICSKTFRNLREEAVENGELRTICEGGTRIKLDLKPAEAQFGLGFFYELRAEEVGITRVIPLSPAGRAGLKGGEQVVSVMGRPVKRMNSAELRSLINANAPQGVKMVVRGETGQKDISIKEGPIYIQGGK